MHLEINGKNGLEITKSMEKYISDKVVKIKEFFHDDLTLHIHVVCKVYRDLHKVEITTTLKNQTLRSENTHEDMYVAISHGVDRIISQAKKHREQVKSRLSKEGVGHVFQNEQDLEDLQTQIKANNLVKNKKIDLEPMTVEEAISQMELIGHDFFVFLNKKTNKVNVVYLRDDFDYAVIETEQ